MTPIIHPNIDKKRSARTCLQMSCWSTCWKQKNPPEPLDEAAAYEASSLISGSFVYNLHRALWLEGLTMLRQQAKLVDELRGKAGDAWEANTLVLPTDKGNYHDLSGIRSSLGRVLQRASIEHPVPADGQPNRAGKRNPTQCHGTVHCYETTISGAGQGRESEKGKGALSN